jgi:hypothetical protein
VVENLVAGILTNNLLLDKKNTKTERNEVLKVYPFLGFMSGEDERESYASDDENNDEGFLSADELCDDFNADDTALTCSISSKLEFTESYVNSPRSCSNVSLDIKPGPTVKLTSTVMLSAASASLTSSASTTSMKEKSEPSHLSPAPTPKKPRSSNTAFRTSPLASPITSRQKSPLIPRSCFYSLSIIPLHFKIIFFSPMLFFIFIYFCILQKKSDIA